LLCRPNRAQASHILVKGPNSLEGCNDLKELIKATINYPAGYGLEDAFKDVATKYSACPSAKKGGYLGSFKPGQMVPEFDQVVFERQVSRAFLGLQA
jgi:peptidyl-prolyl cis-trans isomerase C